MRKEANFSKQKHWSILKSASQRKTACGNTRCDKLVYFTLGEWHKYAGLKSGD